MFVVSQLFIPERTVLHVISLISTESLLPFSLILLTILSIILNGCPLLPKPGIQIFGILSKFIGFPSVATAEKLLLFPSGLTIYTLLATGCFETVVDILLSNSFIFNFGSFSS